MDLHYGSITVANQTADLKVGVTHERRPYRIIECHKKIKFMELIMKINFRGRKDIEK